MKGKSTRALLQHVLHAPSAKFLSLSSYTRWFYHRISRPVYSFPELWKVCSTHSHLDLYWILISPLAFRSPLPLAIPDPVPLPVALKLTLTEEKTCKGMMCAPRSTHLERAVGTGNPYQFPVEQVLVPRRRLSHLALREHVLSSPMVEKARSCLIVEDWVDLHWV